jgi:hypothetical protein
LLRGFAFGITTPEDRELLKTVAEDVLSQDFTHYVWDGDVFKPDSFTDAIRHVLHSELGRKPVFAYRSDSSRAFLDTFGA